MKRAGLALTCITLLFGVLAAAGADSIGSGARAQAGDWFYQVYVDPDYGGNPATHLYSALYYCPGCNTFPAGDTSYNGNIWTSASDQDYPSNWYQVGYTYNNPSYGPSANQIFMQTTLSLDQNGTSYIVCIPPYTSPSIGALNQAGGGCIGNANTLGLVANNYYYVEIYSDENCAQGSRGCVYGCNGNRDFAIAGVEIAHFADCSVTDGSNGITAANLEPEDGDVTPENATNLYSSYDYLGYAEAIIFGQAYTPNALNQRCGYSPPPGAGTVVYSTTEATATTYGGTCPPSGQSPLATGATSRTAPPAPPRFAGAKTIAGPAPAPVHSLLPQATTQPSLVYDPAHGNLPHHHSVPPRGPAPAGVRVVGSPSPTSEGR